MAEDKVFMDTNVFTGIVNDIRNAADSLVLSEELLSKTRDMRDQISSGVEPEDITWVVMNSGYSRAV